MRFDSTCNFLLSGRLLDIRGNELAIRQRTLSRVSADEVLARIEALSSSALTPKRFRQRLEQFRAAGDSAGERAGSGTRDRT